MEPYLHFHIRLVGLAVMWVFKGKFHVFFCGRTYLSQSFGVTKYKDVQNTDCCVVKLLTTVRKRIRSGDTAQCILKLVTRFWASCKLPITPALPSVEAIRIGTG